MGLNKVVLIEELAVMLDCSITTVRRDIKSKRIPQPMPAKIKGQQLRWRRNDIEKHLKIGDYQSAAPVEDSIEANLTNLLRAIVRQEVRNEVDYLIKQSTHSG
ncbi:hypothetical protein A9Q81_16005 [Gammaproteobacteria bacterium 42_54_T18]|nr:hypothetical protein A9Q81_16005 [Gammaproteobacteria bacterium 42_54_T18]